MAHYLSSKRIKEENILVLIPSTLSERYRIDLRGLFFKMMEQNPAFALEDFMSQHNGFHITAVIPHSPKANVSL